MCLLFFPVEEVCGVAVRWAPAEVDHDGVGPAGGPAGPTAEAHGAAPATGAGEGARRPAALSDGRSTKAPRPPPLMNAPTSELMPNPTHQPPQADQPKDD